MYFKGKKVSYVGYYRKGDKCQPCVKTTNGKFIDITESKRKELSNWIAKERIKKGSD